MGREELKWHQLAQNQLTSPQGPHFSPHGTTKPIIKAQMSGKLVSSGISDIVFASVSSEKTRLKKLMIMIIIMLTNLSQEMIFFGVCQKLTSTMKLRPEKYGRLQI